MNKIYLKKTIIILFLMFLIFPSFVCGEQRVSDKGLLTGINVQCYDKGDCSFKDILTVAFNAFNFLRNKIAFPLAVGMLVVGGGMMLLSGGSKKWVEKGKKTFSTAIIGFLIVFGGSVIINSFLLVITFGKITNWMEFFKSALGGALPF